VLSEIKAIAEMLSLSLTLCYTVLLPEASVNLVSNRQGIAIAVPTEYTIPVRPCKVGRLEFKEKKDTYFFKKDSPLGSVSTFALTQFVTEEQRWTPEIVVRRTMEYSTELSSERIWDLD